MCDFKRKRSFFTICGGLFPETEAVSCNAVSISNTERTETTQMTKPFDFIRNMWVFKNIDIILDIRIFG